MAQDSETANEEQSQADRAKSVGRMLNDEEAPVTEPPNEVLPDREVGGASSVGDSIGRRGEDMAAKDGKESGRSEDDVDEGTGRPSGSSTARDATGVNPQEPTTDSPPMGGQGG